MFVVKIFGPVLGLARFYPLLLKLALVMSREGIVFIENINCFRRLTITFLSSLILYIFIVKKKYKGLAFTEGSRRWSITREL